MSIVTRILGLIAALLLLVAGVELFNGISLRNNRLAELRGDTQQLANIAALDLAGILEGSRQLLATLAKLPNPYGWDQRACSILMAAASSDLEYDHIIAVDSSGSIRCSSNGATRVGAVMPDLDLLDRVLASGGFAVGSYGLGTRSGNEVIRVGYPMVDEAGRVIGAVYAGINVSWLNAAISQWKLGQIVTISMADRNGILVARSPESAHAGQRISDSLMALLHAPAAGILEAVGPDGIPRLFGYVPIDVEPAKGIAVFVGRNHANVLAEINRSIFLNAMTLVGVLLLSIIATLIFVRRYLTRPFQILLTVAARWRDGDWSARAGTTGTAEFDRLASAFDGMAAGVWGRDRALKYRDAISHAVTKCAEELVTTDTIGEAIPRILKTMGEALNADRIVVLELQSAGPPLQLHHAWHGAGATCELNADYFASVLSVEEPDIAEWLMPLRMGKMVAATRRDVHGAARKIFDTTGIASNLQAPITVDGKSWGQLGVDDCRIERFWTPSEMDAVRVLANLIGAAIARARHLEKLQFVNTLLKTQMEMSPDAIVVVDANRRITSFNRQLAEIWRLPSNLVESGGTAKTFAVSVKDPETYLSGVQYYHDHPEASGHDEVETSDGRFIDRHTAPLSAADGRHLGRVWFFRDITDRRKAERALVESEMKFRTILEASSDGITVVDADARTFTLANQAACTMMGYALDELMALRADHIYAADDMAAAEQRLQRLRGGKAVRSYGVRIKRKDGSEFLADISAAPLTLEGRRYVVRTFRDVTERKRAEDALQRERKFSAAVIDGLPGIFFVLDSQGRTVRFNDGLIVATGRTSADLTGTSALRSVVEPDQSLAATRIRETLERGQSEAEIGLLHVDGTTRRFLIKAHRIELEEGPGILGVGLDVTKARHIEMLLRESEQRFRVIFASVSDGIFVYDAATGARVEANQSVCDLFGYTRDEILECGFGSLSSGIPPYTMQEAQEKFDAASAGRMQAYEWQCKAKDGSLFLTEMTLRKVEFGDHAYLLSTVHDITERKASAERILQLARFDNLTNLANRVVFAEALQDAIAEAQGSATSFAVLYLDLDHFKDVNDTLGHPIGDALLKLVAQRLSSAVREGDTVSRFGGDEFAVMQADIEDPTDAGFLADRLLDSLNQPYVVGGDEIRSGASIGIAVYGPDATDAETLLSRADVALYRAKAEGRGTYRFFTDAMDAEVRTRVSLGNDLRSAISAGQLFLEYQPQVEAATGRIVGVEALIRWRHPRRGLVPPVDFIPVAERNGLIVAIGHWVLWEACRQAKAWRDAGIPPVIMAVNVSSLQFKSPLALEKDIQLALAEFELPAEMLELELTESALMDASLHRNDVLTRLRALGLRLAIDDFGTGYSSLDYLRRFPFDRLKIAQNFIIDLGVAPGNAVIVRAAIGMARELGIAVLAEGVETEAQLELLLKWGCSDIQGFYFSQPLAPESIEPLLRNGCIAPPEPLLAA